MKLTQAQLDKFEQALSNQAAPSWDPDFKVTKALLTSVAKQGQRIYALERKVAKYKQVARTDAATIQAGMLRSLNQKVTKSSLSKKQIDEALAATDEMIKAAKSGKQVLGYAGSILKFVSKLVL
jgi:hypothetical protein